jgi:hypothetical protein
MRSLTSKTRTSTHGQITNKENAYEYARSNKENAYEYARYCKTNKAQQYSKGKQVTFDLPLDLKELWCDNPAKRAFTQGGGQTRRNFNVPYIICGTSMFLT